VVPVLVRDVEEYLLTPGKQGMVIEVVLMTTHGVNGLRKRS
jgi:hypothetical protein